MQNNTKNINETIGFPPTCRLQITLLFFRPWVDLAFGTLEMFAQSTATRSYLQYRPLSQDLTHNRHLPTKNTLGQPFKERKCRNTLFSLMNLPHFVTLTFIHLYLDFLLTHVHFCH